MVRLFESMRQSWEERGRYTTPGTHKDGVVALDNFSGMGALLLALARTNLKVGRYMAIDMDPVCGIMLMTVAEYCMELYPHLVSWQSVAHMFALWGDIQEVRALDLVPWCPFNVCGCGSPCQGFSRASGNARGFDDPRSQLIYDGVRVRDAVREISWEAHKVTLYWYFENVDPSEHLPQAALEINEITGAVGVTWNGGRVATCERVRCWWTNPELNYAPPPLDQEGLQLGVTLKQCGGMHYPRISPYTDPPGMIDIFNIKGQVMTKAVTVMASKVTRSLRLPPHGTGSGLHYNTVTGELEPLWPEERFAVMTWPSELPSRAPLSNDDSNHCIGNGMVLAAVEWWLWHLPLGDEDQEVIHHLLSPEYRDIAEPAGNQPRASVLEPLHERGRRDPTTSIPPQINEVTSDEWVGTEVEHPEGEAPSTDGLATKIPRDAGEVIKTSITEDAGKGEPTAPPEEIPPHADFVMPEESGFADRDAGQFDAHVKRRLEAAAKEGYERKFDPLPSEEELRAGVRQVMREIATAVATPDDKAVQMGAEALAAEILDIRGKCLDPDNFQAARYHLHWAAWDEMCEELWRMGYQEVKRTSEQKKVLRDLKEGTRPTFWELQRGFDEGHPSFARKFKCIFRDLLDMGYSEKEASEILSGSEPKPMRFRNRPTVQEHIQWVTDAVIELLKNQGARIWKDLPISVTGGEDPIVISPLSVAIREKDGKKRLVIDLRYFNLWLKYLTVRFDGVKDLADMVDTMQKLGATEVVVCLSDMKAGYLHVPIAPECWKYFCFELAGVVMCYTVLNFGFSQSPRLYVGVEGLKHSVYRTLGVQLVEYIDDSARPYTSKEKSLITEKLLLRLGTLLGGYYSFGKMTRGPAGEVFFEKMQLWPERSVEFLGFLLDLVSRRISIPDKKLRYILRRVREWLEMDELAATDMARLAGLLISIQPAVPISRALAHDCFKAVSGATSWREAFPTPEYIKVLLTWLSDNLELWNGQHWYTYPAGISVRGDYSPNGTGGIIFKASLEDGGVKWSSQPRDLPIEVASSFSPEEWEMILQGTMSSALGEAVAMRHLLQVTVDEAPLELIQGRTLVYGGDGEAHINATNKIYSPVPAIQAVVLDCHAMVLRKGGRLEAVWMPRDQNWWADHNSKLVDSSAWRLNWPDTKWVWRTLLEDDIESAPNLDGWADNLNFKCKAFIARWPCPGALAVNARVNGALMAQISPVTGRKFLVWMNPPFSLWGEVVRMIRYHKIDCIVVYPAWRGEVTRSIERLPMKAGPLCVPHHKHMFIPGPRVPAEQRASGPRFHLRVGLVRWD